LLTFSRFSSEEARAIDRLQLDMYNEIRQAAEAHRLDLQIQFEVFVNWILDLQANSAAHSVVGQAGHEDD
jgi:hypothetical protein